MNFKANNNQSVIQYTGVTYRKQTEHLIVKAKHKLSAPLSNTD